MCSSDLSITREALHFAFVQVGVDFSEDNENELLDAYLELTHYEEVEQVLENLKPYQTAIFSNGSLDMLSPLVEQSSFGHLLDEVLTVDEVKQFKPTPMAYQLVLKSLGVKREEVLFMSSNPWDIAGATNFGFHTAWINRQDKVMDELGVKPHFVYKDLRGILEHKS